MEIFNFEKYNKNKKFTGETQWHICDGRKKKLFHLKNRKIKEK